MKKVYNQNGGVQAQSTTKAGTVEAGGRKKSNKYRYGVFRENKHLTMVYQIMEV